uniref:Uncharacterized protein LOC100177741 n=1 Tax=Phallusia mammillata TaxID=59560 RepID=A0A6F9DG16_9ASCI|nr:uncharacterized protein LOC100177741 [Phallusia mammillata]
MKKRSFAETSKTSWDNYHNNFSDLLVRSESPHRKLRKKEVSKLDCPDNLSQDVSISWSSSEDENREENNNLSKEIFQRARLSPVMASSTKKSDVISSVLKNTPSGSPVLTQSRFSTVRKKHRRPSLLPLSPITPGAIDNISFTHLSHISICPNNESSFVQSELDSTPLALPLVDSDDDIVTEFQDHNMRNNETLTQDDIETVTTQTASEHSTKDASDSDCNITISEDKSSQNDHSTCSDSAVEKKMGGAIRPKGSSWIESLVEKIDENIATVPPTDCTSTMNMSFYDSSKKQKFIRDGLAEQLQHVLRQEKSSKVLFQHQIKETTEKEAFHCCLKLKALSHHREGGLHILECRAVVKGGQVQSEGFFYTVLLQHELVVESNINLRSTFIIHPPWKTINLEDHLYPVILCVNHIRVENELSSNQQSSCLTETSSNKSVISDTSKLNACESLLQALENCDHQSISLAATIQRIYCKSDLNLPSAVQTLLCEDAFGVFFELEVNKVLCHQNIWLQLLEHGEGQRVLFQNLTLKGRTTKAQSPRLLSLISSVWNVDGRGLLQVQSSQSQSDTMTPRDSQKVFQPPSFCYILSASQTNCSVLLSSLAPSAAQLRSSFNRPSLDGEDDCDVLYTPVQSLCTNVLDLASVEKSRVSLLGKVVHCKSYNSQETKGFKSISSKVLCLLTLTQEVIVMKLQNVQDMECNFVPGNCVLLKDVYYATDQSLCLDTYSQCLLLTARNSDQNISQCDFAVPNHVFPTFNEKMVSELQLAKLKTDMYPTSDTDVGTIVSVQGVLRSATHDCTSHDSLGQEFGFSSKQSMHEIRIAVSPTTSFIVKVCDFSR